MAMENLNSGNQILQIAILSCGEDYLRERIFFQQKGRRRLSLLNLLKNLKGTKIIDCSNYVHIKIILEKSLLFS